MAKQQYLEAGQIVNTHGIRGEVKITPWADSPEFIKSFKTLYVDGSALKVVSARVHGEFVIVKFEGYDDINAAMTLKTKSVYIDRKDAKLKKGAYFLADIIGASVVTEDGIALGTLTEIMERPAHDIFIVQGDEEHLIPNVPEFIKKVDADAGIVTVHIIDGM